MRGSILIIDDERELARGLKRSLRASGWVARTAHSAVEARLRLAETQPDVVLLDIDLPDADGSELVADLKARYPATEFIMITGHGSIRSAVDSTRRGAVDYLEKPLDNAELDTVARRALDATAEHMTAEERCLASIPPGLSSSTERTSPAMEAVFEAARHAAQRRRVVAVVGERGTGRSWLARWIHEASTRATGPFVSVSAEGVTEEDLEARLFGVGAAEGRCRPGAVEAARGGTLLIKEVAEMSHALQGRLLDLVEEGRFTPRGAGEALQAEIRPLVTSSTPLAEALASGQLVEPLHKCLATSCINLPPLRDRSGDVLVIAREILVELGRSEGTTRSVDLDEEAAEALRLHPWPGNVGELRGVLERALRASGSTVLRRADLDLPPGPVDWCLS